MISLCQSYRIEASLLKKWLLIILLAKLLWFTAFIALRSNQWSEFTSAGGWGLFPNESYSYYNPLENFVSHGEYTSICRMPGLLPFYVPLRFLLDETPARQGILVLQILMDVLATLALGILAARIFQSIRALHIALVLSCISTFTAVRNNFLLSDSLCISTTILSIYSLSNFLIHERIKQLWFAAIGLCVALFLRPAMVALVPICAFLLLLHRGISWRTVAFCSLLAAPTILSLSIWTIRNRMTDGRTIVFVAPLGECQPQITPDFAAIRQWIIATGGDYQPWAKGGESYWFFDSPRYQPLPFQADDFTSEYDTTTIIALKGDYHMLHSGLLSDSDSLQLQQSIIQRADSCFHSYVREHPLHYYLLNRLKFLNMILFPHRIDDLPFPAFHQMNTIQKLIKAGSLLMIPLLSLCSILAFMYWIIKRKWSYLVWMAIPMGLIILHASIGFVEQRYLASSYPFLVMLVAGFFSEFIPAKDIRKNGPANTSA